MVDVGVPKLVDPNTFLVDFSCERPPKKLPELNMLDAAASVDPPKVDACPAEKLGGEFPKIDGGFSAAGWPADEEPNTEPVVWLETPNGEDPPKIEVCDAPVFPKELPGESVALELRDPPKILPEVAVAADGFDEKPVPPKTLCEVVVTVDPPPNTSGLAARELMLIRDVEVG